MKDKLKCYAKTLGGLTVLYALVYAGLSSMMEKSYEASDRNRDSYKAYCKEDFRVLRIKRPSEKEKFEEKNIYFTKNEAQQIKTFLLNKNIIVRHFIGQIISDIGSSSGDITGLIVVDALQKTFHEKEFLKSEYYSSRRDVYTAYYIFKDAISRSQSIHAQKTNNPPQKPLSCGDLTPYQRNG